MFYRGGNFLIDFWTGVATRKDTDWGIEAWGNIIKMGVWGRHQVREGRSDKNTTSWNKRVIGASTCYES